MSEEKTLPTTGNRLFDAILLTGTGALLATLVSNIRPVLPAILTPNGRLLPGLSESNEPENAAGFDILSPEEISEYTNFSPYTLELDSFLEQNPGYDIDQDLFKLTVHGIPSTSHNSINNIIQSFEDAEDLIENELPNSSEVDTYTELMEDAMAIRLVMDLTDHATLDGENPDVIINEIFMSMGITSMEEFLDLIEITLPDDHILGNNDLTLEEAYQFNQYYWSLWRQFGESLPEKYSNAIISEIAMYRAGIKERPELDIDRMRIFEPIRTINLPDDRGNIRIDSIMNTTNYGPTYSNISPRLRVVNTYFDTPGHGEEAIETLGVNLQDYANETDTIVIHEVLGTNGRSFGLFNRQETRNMGYVLVEIELPDDQDIDEDIFLKSRFHKFFFPESNTYD